MAKIPFSIDYRPQIESGEYKVVCGELNFPVRIICWNARGVNDKRHIVALSSAKEDTAENILRYYEDGHLISDSACLGTKDLFIVTPEPELTDWEGFISGCLQKHGLLDCGAADRIARECSAELLSLAREQFIKDGYVIVKKAFLDAVENIFDKHLAEMSVEYAIHCKVKDGVRNAVMNWPTFQKVAQKFIDIGKAEALKELPRWRKCDGLDTGQTTVVVGYTKDEDKLFRCGKVITLNDLEKLPGFKED